MRLIIVIAPTDDELWYGVVSARFEFRLMTKPWELFPQRWNMSTDLFLKLFFVVDVGAIDLSSISRLSDCHSFVFGKCSVRIRPGYRLSTLFS
jgi:hypothetical protein